MAIHDATVEVTCDGEHCRENITITPNYVYSTYSGKGGRYDTDDSAIEEKIEAEGWLVKDGKHYCESCAEARKETATEDEEEPA